MVLTGVSELDLDIINKLDFKAITNSLDEYNPDVYSLVLRDFITRDEDYQDQLFWWFGENNEKIPESELVNIFEYLIENSNNTIEHLFDLYTEIENHPIELYDFLIQNIKDIEGDKYILLEEAVKYGDLENVKVLIENGAKDDGDIGGELIENYIDRMYPYARIKYSEDFRNIIIELSKVQGDSGLNFNIKNAFASTILNEDRELLEILYKNISRIDLTDIVVEALGHQKFDIAKYVIDMMEKELEK